ncbi:hypothetical protein ACFE04_011948 [Oxalis oulophora]
MAFQDFDLISERRRAERERKFKKRIAIGAVTAFVLVALVCAAVVAVVHQDKAKKEDTSTGSKKSPASSHDSPKSDQDSSTKDVTHTQKLIKGLCNATTYQDKCNTTLISAIKENPKLSQPKALLQSAISAASEEIKKALSKADSMKFDTEKEKAAFADCKILIKDAVEELNSSVAELGEKDAAGNLTAKTPALNNWLSAVMSYTSTCIDGFNETKSKPDMEKNFNATQQLTSNSLAIVKELTSVLSTFLEMTQGKNRRLLGSGAPTVEKDGFPTWMSADERRMLKGSDDEKPTPNVTVAKDGSGKFKTISEALLAMPKTYDGRYVIYVKAGIYDESVTVTKEMVNVTIYGDGSQKTIVTGSKSYVDGIQVFQTATFVAIGDGFLAKAMGFRNTAGAEKRQAVAIRVQADRAIFLNCRFEGYQATLFAQVHRQFYRGCVISGSLDIIFGDAAAIFQTCLIYVRKPLENQPTAIAAQGREDKFETTGIVLQNCRILADKDFEADSKKFENYLGRPWKEYSRTIVMETEIPDFISPDGWVPWMGDYGTKTCFFAEFENKGPGAKTDGRVKWAQKGFTKKQAEEFTVGPFLQGEWISKMGVPVRFGLFA